jgi:hypothetical protein
MKVGQVGSRKRRMRGMAWKRRVRAKVVEGVIGGRTAKAVSPTRPRVTLWRAEASTGRPMCGATLGG